MSLSYSRALIVGAGDGLSASVARTFASAGLKIGLAARNIAKLERLIGLTDARAARCDVSRREEVDALFAAMDRELRGAPDVVVYNPGVRLRGPFVDLDPAAVANAIAVSAYGGFLVAQAAVKRMLPRKHGAMFFTGASASIKGYAQSAPFAMGKFALRGLAQSMARELQPQGIHVAHFVIDGVIRNPGRKEAPDAPDSMLDPDAIAKTYLHVLLQDRSAWTSEIELRPWVERF